MSDLTGPTDSSAIESSTGRPTWVRWQIVALIVAYAFLCHFNRYSIQAAGNDHIMKEYSISKTKMGLIYSAYLLVYTVCMTPGGWLIDRFGPRTALVLVGFASAIFVALTGIAGMVVSAA